MPEKYCRACGAELASGLKFCEKCGTATVAEAPPVAEAAPAAEGAPAAVGAAAASPASAPASAAQAASPLSTVKGRESAAMTQPVRGVVDDGDTLGRPVKKRSYVFIYWAIIAIICLVVGVMTAPWLILVAIGAGAYSFYIYRGGSWVFWIGP